MTFRLDILFAQVEFLRLRIIRIADERIQTHYYAWCTKAALAAMQLGDAFLERVRLVHATDSFDRDDMLAVNTDERE
jgi:hypothetical protein